MRTLARRSVPLFLALVVATGLLAAPMAAPPVRAATPDLTIVSDARYDVQPDQKRVRVTVTLRLTNHLKDTATKRYYFDQAFLAVLPGASGFRLTGVGTPSVSVTKRSANATILRLRLGARLFSGKSATYTLRFDLVDGGGAATRDLRIGDSLASFPVWAYATDSTPGSTVTVVFPAGYQTTIEAGDIPAPTTDSKGKTIYRTGKLAAPLTFFAYLVGDRPGAYDERALTTVVGDVTVPLTVRAWADDAAWSKRVGNLVRDALPTLGEAVGLPWPREDTLVIQEAVSRSTGGYAGLFDPTQGLVEVAYYAGDLVVLHEAAHAWFNGSLLADRWANEAFASYYGVQAGNALKIDTSGNELTDTLRESAIPLNAWGPVGKESTAIEDYAYAATLALANAIAERAGPDGLRAVWADASGRIGAYQPPEAGRTGVDGQPWTPETIAGPPDWRVLLDLLEADTPATYDDLWRTWVAREEDLPLLDDRAAARARYDAVLADAGDWQLPRPIRDAMRAWRFDDATDLLADAGDVLARRDEIAAAAAAAGLVLPTDLRLAFEGTGGFAAALEEADAEAVAIEHYQAAADAEPIAPDLVAQVGMWGSTPETDLAAAKAAFMAGDLESAVSSSDAARSVWTSAEDVGRGRLVSVTALVLALVAALVLFALTIRSRRRHTREAIAYMQSMSRPPSRMMARPLEPGEVPGWGSRTASPAGALVTDPASPAGPPADPPADPPVADDRGADATEPYATLAATPGEPSSAATDEHDTGARPADGDAAT